MKRGAGFAVLLGFVPGLALAFTNQAAPSRHPSPSPNLSTDQIYVYDPYSNGSSTNGVPNIVGKTVTCADGVSALGLYDDGGSLATTCISGATTGAVTSPPSAPTAGQTNFAFAVDAGFPTIPTTIDSFMGIPIPVGMLGAYFPVTPGANSGGGWYTHCVMPQGWTQTAVIGIGILATTPQSSGTPGSPAWATTSVITRAREINYQTAASTNAAAHIRECAAGTGQMSAWRGNSANAGGFYFWGRTGVNTGAANSRFAAGLFNTTNMLTASADPNAATDTVYFGCNQGDTNLSICSNDNVGTATCNTLGASFPCTTSGAYYDLWLAAAPNGSVINWSINRIDSAAQASGQISSDLPRNTVQMNWQFWIDTGSGSAQLKVAFDGVCVATNF